MIELHQISLYWEEVMA